MTQTTVERRGGLRTRVSRHTSRQHHTHTALAPSRSVPNEAHVDALRRELVERLPPTASRRGRCSTPRIFRCGSWFVAVYLMTESQRSISAHELRGILGGSYKTYWFAMHRIRVAMLSRLEPVDGRRDAAVDESRLRRERSARDRRAYVGEQRWRELNDRNPGVFRDTIVALFRCGGVSYGSLTGHRTVTTC